MPKYIAVVNTLESAEKLLNIKSIDFRWKPRREQT